MGPKIGIDEFKEGSASLDSGCRTLWWPWKLALWLQTLNLTCFGPYFEFKSKYYHIYARTWAWNPKPKPPIYLFKFISCRKNQNKEAIRDSLFLKVVEFLMHWEPSWEDNEFITFPLDFVNLFQGFGTGWQGWLGETLFFKFPHVKSPWGKFNKGEVMPRFFQKGI